MFQVVNVDALPTPYWEYRHKDIVVVGTFRGDPERETSNLSPVSSLK